MREIKFRAWSKYHQRIYESFEVYKICQSADLEFPEDTSEDWKPGSVLVGHVFAIEEGIIPIWLLPEDVILMQYTGLKDKNGEEIYEGDIVQIIKRPSWMCDATISLQETVNWSSEYAAFSPFYWDYNDITMWLDALSDGSLGVIGNIYENPELLQPTSSTPEPSA